jgi:hypothetical protein
MQAAEAKTGRKGFLSKKQASASPTQNEFFAKTH